MDGVYLFCLAPAEGFRLPDTGGLDEGEPLAAVDAGPIVAVTCRVALDDFAGPEAEARMRDLAWLGPRALRHERAIEAAMATGPVLPANFGAIFSSVGALRALVAANEAAILEFFERARGAGELSVKALFDRKRAKEGAFAALVAERAGELSKLTPGTRYFHEQKLRAQADREVATRVRAACAAAVARLAAVAPDPRERAARPKDDGTEVAAHWAFLVRDADREGFAAAVAAESAALAEAGVELEVTGPWPPYTFAPRLAAPGAERESEDGARGEA